MRAVVYEQTGPSSVLQLVQRPDPEPGPGEVVVRLQRAGVNPTDWKFRATGMNGDFAEVVPGQDGAGVVEAVGDGVTSVARGDRVWLFLAQYERPFGTAAEVTVQPAERVVRLPDPLDDDLAFDLGASLGVPAMTAHRALTSGDVPRLAPGSLDGATVLVAGGAGAVGNAAIQLARWAGARVLTTVSSHEKAALATAAGAHEYVDYRAEGPEGTQQRIGELAPDGVDLIVEVALAANLDLDLAVLRTGGTIALYGATPDDVASVPVRQVMSANARLQGILLYTVRPDLLAAAADDVAAAVAAGALGVGEEHGLPLRHYPLEQTAAAHDAVEQGAVGKVLLTL